MPSAAFLGSIFNVPVSGASDPYYANVVALLHFDNNYTDQKAHVWTPSGSPIFNTVTPMVGSGNLHCQNNTRYVRSASSSDFVLGTGPFTIEMKIRCTAGATPANVYMFDSGTGFGSAIQFGTTGLLSYYTASLGDSTTLYTDGPHNSVVCDGNTHTIAISRVSGTTRAFFDGVMWGSAADSGNYSFNNFVINGYGGADGVYGGDIEFDELRITKGVGRYSSNYTPSALAFPDS